MRKLFLSLLGGLVFGLGLSFVFFDYQSSWTSHLNRAGVNQVVKEMDFDFVFNASLLVIIISIMMYMVWTFIEKKKDEKFLRNYKNSKRKSE